MIDLIGKAAPQQQVVGSLEDGLRFRSPILEFKDGRLEVTGWTTGTKLYGTESRVRVRLDGGQKQVTFDDGGRARSFTSLGTSEVNWPTSIEVTRIQNLDVSKRRGIRTGDGGMAQITEAQEKSLRTKYKYQVDQKGKAELAGDQGKATLAWGRIEKLLVEAEQAGVNLEHVVADKPAHQVVTDDASDAAVKAVEGDTEADKKAEAKAAKAKAAADDKAAKATRRAEAAEIKRQKDAKAKADRAEAKKEQTEASAAKRTKTCLCGCGGTTGGNFLPGHDARVKGMLLKVERGEAKAEDLPAVLLDHVGFEGDAETAKSDTSTFRIAYAPVRFPGRPEIVARPVEEAEAA